ncbi:hypothetical protein H4R35_007426 [Dimargaris xerosporica]|nr:hypothetical protein H4R35_007426 [Dimargaris xerosporica]
MSVVHPSSAPTLPPIPDNTGAPHTYLGALTLESTRGIPREAADRHFDPNADTKPRHETQRPLLPLTNTQQPLSPKSLASASLNQASAARQGTRGKTRKGQFVTRTRLYVSKACINCRNSKVACENARPCQRCVRLNKADTCVDAASKRRGRPGNVQFASSLLDPSDEASNAPVISSHSRAAGVSSAPLYRVSLPATRALSHCASALDAEPLASATSTMVLTSSAATSTAVPSTEPAKPASFKFRIKSVQHFNTGASRRADEDGFIHYLSTNSDAQTSASTLTRECITPASFPESTASFASGILRPSLASDANLSSYQHIHTTSTAGEPRTKFLLKTPESFESPYLRVARDDSSSLSASKATSHSHSFIQSRPLIFNCTTPANFNTDSGSAQSSPNLRPTKAARVKAILSRPTKESGGDKLRPQHVDHQSKAPSDHQAHATSPTLPRAGPMALSTITDPFNTDVRLVRRSSSADRPGPVSPQSNLAPRDSRSSPSSMPSEDEIDIAHFLLTNSQKHHTLPRP